MSNDIDGKSAAPVGDAIVAEAIETKSIAPAAAPIALVKEELPIIEAPKLAADAPTPKLAEAPNSVEAAKLAEPEPINENATAAPPSGIASFIPAWLHSSARTTHSVPLAASVALAAIIGGLAGALGAAALLHATDADIIAEAAPMPTIVDETRAMQGALTQLRSDLAALKTSTKGSTGQLAKINERFDRVERAQSEPAAKIGKVAEALERLEKRVDALTARETTGSVSAPQSSTANASAPPAPAIVDGWVVRDVYRGAALIQGRRFGLIEVQTGDIVPGIGRIEAIRKQDGRWVVVTPKGIIAAAR